eukprot:6193651-Pleurochrysis_carterae.AAC.1
MQILRAGQHRNTQARSTSPLQQLSPLTSAWARVGVQCERCSTCVRALPLSERLVRARSRTSTCAVACACVAARVWLRECGYARVRVRTRWRTR